ncbi:hypothetical protein JQ607_05750 [Bradyrhizobium liaoningense]|uniref:hypothetical protein n=1 Tax=Bradyrhizobium liaoningense TaxID=43992 RepID=UPI001BAC7F0B|nr:hypothetical protein [Bradyrhizobium liaoningense]MBR0839694.1 hypothetical protein [Bradyrhizobium liaoningense]MBR0855927.1 hypothetical protein [Bradyrhizobium liaoningense]
MRFAFVLVNGRTPFRQTCCMQCCEPIGGGYLREIATRLPYCDHQCYALYCEALAKDRMRAAS